ncbi:tumor protein, partial [Baffinella frigidus]
LQRHERTHTGEKRYRCEFVDEEGVKCTRAFGTSDQLKEHYRNHTGLKPYKCWDCARTFTQHNSRKEHWIRIH